MEFNSYIGIDWSGDKNKYQKGISVAKCEAGNRAPYIILPPKKYWTRTDLISWLINEISKEKILVGIDFSFSYPFYDKASYFPGVKDSPINPHDLWKMIDNINSNNENFYGGGVWNLNPYKNFYNSPKFKGKQYSSRRRLTEIISKTKKLSPSPTFNCVGPGAVGTGSLAGMRVLNFLKNKVYIWPFEKLSHKQKSVVVEVFPSFYFRVASVKPTKKIGYTLENINLALNFFKSSPLLKEQIISGPDQDDADSIISSAALRFYSRNNEIWKVPKSSQKEGWIFGV